MKYIIFQLLQVIGLIAGIFLGVAAGVYFGGDEHDGLGALLGVPVGVVGGLFLGWLPYAIAHKWFGYRVPRDDYPKELWPILQAKHPLNVSGPPSQEEHRAALKLAATSSRRRRWIAFVLVGLHILVCQIGIYVGPVATIAAGAFSGMVFILIPLAIHFQTRIVVFCLTCGSLLSGFETSCPVCKADIAV